MKSSSTAIKSTIEKPRRKRLLENVACEVCEDNSTGKHYGVYVCDGCSGFFKRTVRRATPWVCRRDGKCIIDRASRNDCRACRFKKCLMVNMTPEDAHSAQNKESDSRHLYLISSTSDVNQAGTVLPTVENTSLTKAFSDGVSSFSATVPSSLTSSPSILMPTGNTSQELPGKQDSPVLIKVETKECDIVEAVNDLENENSKNQKKNLSSLLLRLPISGQTSLASSSQPVAPVIPTTRRDSQLVRTQMLVAPKTSFTHHHPNQSKNCPSISPVATARYVSSEREKCSPVTTEYSHKDPVNKTAVQQLSSLVQFVKNIPTFKSLPFRDQVILLEESWKDVFLLHAAFSYFPLEISFVIPPCETNPSLVSSLRILQELLTRIQALQLDETECNFLKTVVIFKPDIKGLKDSEKIQKLQDEAQVRLMHYVKTRVEDPARFGRLLLSLPGLERISQEMLEKLFFRQQNESFELILHDLFKKS